jgi:hypothetical protein
MERIEIIDSLVKMLLDDNNLIEEINIDNEFDEIIKNGKREVNLTGRKTIEITLLNKNQFEEYNNKKSSF